MSLEKIAKKISNYYSFLTAVILILIFAILTVEVFSGIISRIDSYKLYTFSKALGGVGTFLAFTAVIFFPLRKIGIPLKKRYAVLSSAPYVTAMKVTAFLHPVIALFAFFLLFLHGFIFLKIIYNFDFSIVLIMGIMALLALTSLFITGTFLKKKLSRKNLRKVHFTIAITFIIFYTLHMFVM
jgi:hypothetical protein